VAAIAGRPVWPVDALPAALDVLLQQRRLWETLAAIEDTTMQDFRAQLENQFSLASVNLTQGGHPGVMRRPRERARILQFSSRGGPPSARSAAARYGGGQSGVFSIGFSEVLAKRWVGPLGNFKSHDSSSPGGFPHGTSQDPPKPFLPDNPAYGLERWGAVAPVFSAGTMARQPGDPKKAATAGPETSRASR